MLGFGWLQCRRTRPALWDYASERLSEGPMETVEQHLHGCDSCRREVESLRSAQTFLSACRAEEEPAPSSDWNALRQRLQTQSLRNQSLRNQSAAGLSEPSAPRRHARYAPAILRGSEGAGGRAPWQMQLVMSMVGGFAAVGIVAVGYGLLMRHQAVPVTPSGMGKPGYVQAPAKWNAASVALFAGASQKPDASSAHLIGHVVDVLNHTGVKTAAPSASPHAVQLASSGVTPSAFQKQTVASLPRVASITPRPKRRAAVPSAAERTPAERAAARLAHNGTGGLHFRPYTQKPEDRLPSTEQTASRYALEQVRPVGNDSDNSNVYVVGTVQPASHDDDHDY